MIGTSKENQKKQTKFHPNKENNLIEKYNATD